MVIIKVKDMLIKIVKLESGEIKACVINTDLFTPDDLTRMDKNLNLLIQAYSPSPEHFGMPATNAIALWLVKGYGCHGEVIRFDECSGSSGVVK